MRLYIDKQPIQEFQLAPDFFPELSRTNPFLTEEGSMSIPLTLPSSSHNMKLVGFAYRGRSTNRPAKKILAILQHGTTSINGTLYIDTINETEGITCTFYTNEGQFNERIKDYKLADLDWPVHEGSGSTYAQKAIYWMNQFKSIMNGTAQAEDYFVFGVMTDSVFRLNKENDVDVGLMLNETDGVQTGWKYLAESERTYYTEAGDDATPYTVPVGYGITPFLRVGYVIRHIISYFGYTLDDNMFDTNASLYRLVLLNNTADAIVSGKLSYRQLLPDDVSVEDFIKFVRTKFGVEFIQLGDHIQIKRWVDVLSAEADKDLSEYVRDEGTFTLVNKRAIQMEFTLNMESEVWDTRVAGLSKQDLSILKHLSPSGLDKESIDIIDKTPIERFKVSGYIYDKFGYRLKIIPLCISGIKNLNTELVLSDPAQKTTEKNENVDIMVCFSRPGMDSYNNRSEYYYYPAGTIYSFTVNGTKSDYSLVANEYAYTLRDSVIVLYEDNLYNKCYKSRDEMLREANQQIIHEAVIPPHIINSIDISTPKIILGQKVLIERIDYVLGRPDLCQITSQTLHPYPD